jgi:DNA-directed RNA polymerase sigma subunit (sigma70/sigma32)
MNIIDYVLFNLTMEEINIYFARKFQKKTFEEIGKEFGVTRERIRQMEARVEDKVRNLGLDNEFKITSG